MSVHDADLKHYARSWERERTRLRLVLPEVGSGQRTNGTPLFSLSHRQKHFTSGVPQHYETKSLLQIPQGTQKKKQKKGSLVA